MLEDLYLSNNQLSGRLPEELGDLAELTALHLSHNQFDGALPGSLAGLTNLADFRWHESGLCAPEAAWFQMWLGSIANHEGGENCSSPISLSLPIAYLNQAAQDVGGDVPLVAGRQALLRIFATADRANNFRPRAEATFFLNGREAHRAEMEFPSLQGIPAVPDQGRLDRSFNTVIPGQVLVPGVEMVINVDPDSIVPRAAGSVVRVPAQGRLSLDVRAMPPMELTVVPVLVANSPDSSVLTWTSAIATQGINHADVVAMRNMLPVGDLTVTVREPYIIARAPVSVWDWGSLALQMKVLRRAENATGTYYATTPRTTGTVAGAALLSEPASVGRPNRHTFIHELGHTMSLRHVPPPRMATRTIRTETVESGSGDTISSLATSSLPRLTT